MTWCTTRIHTTNPTIDYMLLLLSILYGLKWLSTVIILVSFFFDSPENLLMLITMLLSERNLLTTPSKVMIVIWMLLHFATHHQLFFLGKSLPFHLCIFHSRQLGNEMSCTFWINCHLSFVVILHTREKWDALTNWEFIHRILLTMYMYKIYINRYNYMSALIVYE